MGKPSRFNMGLRYAKRMGPKMPKDWTWEQARDFLDQGTGADLEAWALDKITDEAIRTRNASQSELIRIDPNSDLFGLLCDFVMPCG